MVDRAALVERLGVGLRPGPGEPQDECEIAAELFISTSTVKTHLAGLMRKLGARNRVELAIWAHETGRT